MKKFILGTFFAVVWVFAFLVTRSEPDWQSKQDRAVPQELKFESPQEVLPKTQIPAPLFTKVRTPYDKYMIPTVGKVLGKLNGKPLATKEEVLGYLKQGCNFGYKLTDPYIPMMPRELSIKKMGDCKDKSLWLAEKINDPNIQFVIGKSRPEAKISHAWLMWQSEGVWWILDCTNKNYVLRADSIKKGYYAPKYSYTSDGEGSVIASEY